MNIKYWTGGGILALLLVIAVSFLISRQSDCRDFKQGSVMVGDKMLSVSLAKTGAEQQRGLGGCGFIPEDSGMYFIYSPPQQVSFWMKGMVIPIDIIWIADGRVIGMEEFVPPPTGGKTELLPHYRPPRPIEAVLEIEAGGVKKYGVAVGDIVTAQ